MNRAAVDSSTIHSMAHDETGAEVQFHAKQCAIKKQGRPGSSKREAPHGGDLPPAACDCKGGETFFYPGVEPETYLRVINAPSIGSAFHQHIKSAKDSAGGLKYPHQKRTGRGYETA